jgi:uncharacterized membrane protein
MGREPVKSMQIRRHGQMIPWIMRQRLHTFFRTSMWVIPLSCAGVALLVAPAVRWLEAETRWSLLNFEIDGARALLGALIGASLSYIVFLASALLIAVQLMSAQLSPRVIREFMLNWSYRLVLGLFVFTFIYTVSALARTTKSVHQLQVLMAIVFNLASIGAFLYLIDHALRHFRPSAIVNRISAQGLRVIEKCYPLPAESAEQVGSREPGLPIHTILNSSRSGVILAVDLEGLVDIANRSGAVLALIPRVGNFVAKGEPVIEVYGADIDEGLLRKSVALGAERTMDQDPAFAFRILVDIAIKALSPAINDPTTAVVAIDQLNRLLLAVGLRQLDNGPAQDSEGHVRLFLSKPHWQDFVSLAISEVRIYGSGSLQVCRRLDAMIMKLVDLLPRYRAPELARELELLRAGVERQFPDLEDRLCALTPDSLGLGGTPH